MLCSPLWLPQQPLRASQGQSSAAEGRIGGAKGLLAGLLLPGIGVLITAASPKKAKHEARNDSAIHEAARDRAREQFRHDHNEKPRSVHQSNAMRRPTEKRNRGPKL